VISSLIEENLKSLLSEFKFDWWIYKQFYSVSSLDIVQRLRFHSILLGIVWHAMLVAFLHYICSEYKINKYTSRISAVSLSQMGSLISVFCLKWLLFNLKCNSLWIYDSNSQSLNNILSEMCLMRGISIGNVLLLGNGIYFLLCDLVLMTKLH
jgi:hypothetical protein